MKTTFTRTVPAATAATIAREGTKAVLETARQHWDFSAHTWAEKYYDDRWFATGRLDSRRGVYVRPDWTGYIVGFEFVEGGVVLYELTCGGHLHSLEIQRDGLLIVTHEGARRSIPGCFPLPENSQFWEFTDIQNWELIEYVTSEPSWAAVAGLLRGRVGNGPCNAEEAVGLEDRARTDNLLAICQQIDKAVPSGLHFCSDYDDGDGWFDGNGCPVTIKWNAVDYRRAAAVGIKLN